MNKEYINWDALVNYITGQNSLEDEEMIREWMQMDPKHEEFIIFLKKIWDTSAEEKHSWDVDSAWARFSEQYDLSFPEKRTAVIKKHNTMRRRKKNQGRFSWGAVSASLVILLVVLFFGMDISSTQQSFEEQQFREIVTTYGQRTHLNLSDGSSVTLNAGSTLTLPETFGATSAREVHLSGEARFEVIHDPDRPFTVRTEHATTHVLGTTFQVTSYPGGGQMQVVVVDGKVAIRGTKTPDRSYETLSKNQMGVIFDDGLTTVSTLADLTPYLGWTDGKLVFHQDPLDNVLVKLKRWYDIDVRATPALLAREQKTLTATFTQNQPVDEVLEAIALTLDAEYMSIENNSAFIFF